MTLNKRRRKRAGFTLTEMIAVVAVLAILSAVAIPSVVTLRRSLKMTELDAAARDIFVAVQDNLSGLKAADLLDTVQGTAFGGDPQLCHLSTDDAQMAALLPAGAIDPVVRENRYMVLYNWAFGVVLDVWYGESALPAETELLDNMRGSDAATAEARRAAEVGYYAGGDAAALPSGTLPPLSLMVHNGEELQAMIHVGLTMASVLMDAELCLTIRAADGAEEKMTLDDTNAIINRGAGNATVILDSLQEEQRFRVLHGAFTPGEDLTLTASLEPKPGKTSVASVSDPVQCNSLFAGVNGETASIANARHLQNLCAPFSGLVYDPAGVGITAAMQTEDITWPGDTDTFRPIFNETLSDFDGGSHLIRSLVADGGKNDVKTHGVGLFGTVDSAHIRNVVMVDPIIRLTNGGSVYFAGALAGETIGVTIDNCAVYATGTGEADRVDYNNVKKFGITAVTAKAVVGGLVGSLADGAVTNSFAALPYIDVTSTDGSVGGLVGMGNGIIENCYAAVDQIRGRVANAGMFIGTATTRDGRTTQVNDCYAVGNISAEAETYYGFMGGGGTVKKSYTAATYLAADGMPRPEIQPYGFTKAAAGSCAYLASDGVTYQNAEKAKDLDSAALSAWGTGASWTKVSASLSRPYQETLDRKAYPYPALRSASGRVLGHYGSWPEAVVSAAGDGMVYYEVYTDGSFGFYGLDADGKPVDSLKGNEYIIQTTGYGVVQPKGAAQPVLSRSTTWGEYNNAFALAVDIGSGKVLFPFSAAVYDQLPGPYDSPLYLNRSVAYRINHKFAAAIILADSGEELGGKEHPLQIRTQAQLSEVGMGMPSPRVQPAYILQTHNIPISKGWKPISGITDAGRTIDGNGHVISGLTQPLFNDFSGAGGKCTLVNVKLVDADITVTGGSSAGIMANNARERYEIKDCTVMNSTITGTNVAGLVGESDGVTISGCTVENVKVSSSGGKAAGFILENRGTITDCRVSPAADGNAQYDALTVRAEGSNGQAAGFALTNKKSIQNSCAIGTVAALGGQAAGFVVEATDESQITSAYSNCITTGREAAGFVLTAARELTNCYALLEVTGTKQAYGFLGTLSWGTVKNCYTAAAVSGPVGQRYGFAPFGGAVADCYYIGRSGYTQGAGTSVSFGNLTLEYTKFGPTGAWKNPTSSSSHPFDKTLGNTYPFPMLKSTDHYGDWPRGSAVGLVYFEKYQEGGYGVYGLNRNGQRINTLDMDNSYTITDQNGAIGGGTYNVNWGYGILVDGEMSSVQVSGPNRSGAAAITRSDLIQSVNIEDGLTLYILPEEDIHALGRFADGKSPHAAEITVHLNGSQYSYAANLNFAAALAPGGTPLGTAAVPLQIRTSQQFRGIGRAEEKTLADSDASTVKTYADCQFAQTHDITYSSSAPMDGTIHGFTYDGKGNALRELKQHLFSRIMGTVKVSNLNIKEPTVAWSGAGVQNFGLITPVNAGTVVNCHILDAFITVGKITGAAAGFVGTNAAGGEIIGCSVRATGNYGDNAVKFSEEKKTGHNAYGFAVDNVGTIENCFYVGTVTGYEAAGFVRTNAGIISGCYSNASVVGHVTASGFAGENTGVIKSSYSIGDVRQSGLVEAATAPAAFGFAGKNSGGSLKECYSAAIVTAVGTGAVRYGFAKKEGSIQNASYLKTGTDTPVDEGGAQKSFGQLAQTAGGMGNDYQSATAARSHPFTQNLGDNYPFPLLKKLDHYGDWPGLTMEKPFIVFYYYKNADGSYTACATAIEGQEEQGNRLNIGEIAYNFYIGPVTFHAATSPGTSGFGIWDGLNYVKDENVKLNANILHATPEPLKSKLTINGTMGGISFDSSCYLFPSNDGKTLVLEHDKNNDRWTYQFTYSNGLLSGKKTS